jgi:hypothetical protein
MSAAESFSRSVKAPGQETTQTLAQFLAPVPEDSEWLQDQFDKLRQAELDAEQIASTIRFY